MSDYQINRKGLITSLSYEMSKAITELSDEIKDNNSKIEKIDKELDNLKTDFKLELDSVYMNIDNKIDIVEDDIDEKIKPINLQLKSLKEHIIHNSNKCNFSLFIMLLLITLLCILCCLYKSELLEYENRIEKLEVINSISNNYVPSYIVSGMYANYSNHHTSTLEIIFTNNDKSEAIITLRGYNNKGEYVDLESNIIYDKENQIYNSPAISLEYINGSISVYDNLEKFSFTNNEFTLINIY